MVQTLSEMFNCQNCDLWDLYDGEDFWRMMPIKWWRMMGHYFL